MEASACFQRVMDRACSFMAQDTVLCGFAWMCGCVCLLMSAVGIATSLDATAQYCRLFTLLCVVLWSRCACGHVDLTKSHRNRCRLKQKKGRSAKVQLCVLLHHAYVSGWMLPWLLQWRGSFSWLSLAVSVTMQVTLCDSLCLSLFMFAFWACCQQGEEEESIGGAKMIAANTMCKSFQPTCLSHIAKRHYLQAVVTVECEPTSKCWD